jgi:hypothetical protein
MSVDVDIATNTHRGRTPTSSAAAE